MEATEAVKSDIFVTCQHGTFRPACSCTREPELACKVCGTPTIYKSGVCRYCQQAGLSAAKET